MQTIHLLISPTAWLICSWCWFCRWRGYA